MKNIHTQQSRPIYTPAPLSFPKKNKLITRYLERYNKIGRVVRCEFEKNRSIASRILSNSVSECVQSVGWVVPVDISTRYAKQLAARLTSCVRLPRLPGCIMHGLSWTSRSLTLCFVAVFCKNYCEKEHFHVQHKNNFFPMGSQGTAVYPNNIYPTPRLLRSHTPLKKAQCQ